MDTPYPRKFTFWKNIAKDVYFHVPIFPQNKKKK